jgi:pilus assembly protein CpaB
MARMQGLTLTRGNRGLLVVAALAGLAAAVLFVVAVNQDGGSGTVSTGGATVKAVVAKQSIAAGTEIKSDMVEARDVSEDLVVAGALSDTADVVGNVTLGVIPAGEQIIPSRIGLSPTNKSLPVPAGKRAIGVEVREATAAGGHLLPGDHVDVIGVFDPQNTDSALVFESGGIPAFGVPLLQNIEVLAVGPSAQEQLPTTERDPDGDGTPNVATSGKPPENAETQPSAVTVTLAVDPGQAIMLALTQQTGIKVWLTLRAFGDNAEVEMPKVDIGTVVGP